jgi:hypothetical protein
MTERKVKALFLYYGEGRQNDFDEHFAGKSTLGLAIVKNCEEDRLTLEDIFLEDVRWEIMNYNNHTGILKLGLIPSVPIWVFDNFNSWFIPIFEEHVEN